ncbi:MAG: hypothetical protein JO248_13310 [Acidimicrobiia bacterium]|nr:hypothetical protein [Acidimicrobiia bacterium]
MTERHGSEALEYAREHLVKRSQDVERWTEVYECPVTGVRWIADYPHAEMHGGGPMRLRTMTAVSREVWGALDYVAELLVDDPEARADASRLRHRLVVEFPGTDPLAR